MSEATRARPRRSRATPLDPLHQSLAVDLILSEGLTMDDAVARVRARVLRADPAPETHRKPLPARARGA